MKTMHSAVQGIVLLALGAALGAGASGQWQWTGEAQTSPPRATPATKTTAPPTDKAISQAVSTAPRPKRLQRRTPKRSTLIASSLPAPFTLPFYFPTANPIGEFHSSPTRHAMRQTLAIKEKTPALTTIFTAADKTEEPFRATFALETIPSPLKPFLLSAVDATPRVAPDVPIVRLAQLETAPVKPSVAESTTEPATEPVVPPVAAPPVIENGVLNGLLNESDLTGVFAGRPVINETLTPERAVEIALRESPIIRGATAEVEAALGRLDAARAERRPMVSANTFLSGGSIPNIIESPQTIGPSMIMGLPRGGYFDQNLMLMFPLFTGGRIKAMVRQAAALKNASQAELEAQRQEVALLTRLAFREAQARRALVEVQQAKLRESEEQLRIDRVRAEEGKIPPFFVLRSEAEVAATQQELTNARRDVELSLLQLQTVMGISPASQIEIKDALSYEPSTQFLHELAPSAPSNLAALLRLAEKQRPELQAAGHRVLAAQAETSSIRSSYRPQINAFGMGDAMKMQGEQFTGGTTFGLVASMSLFNGGQKKARVATAEAERKKQEAERQRFALQVGQEVTTAVLNLRAAEQNVRTSQVALKSASEDYRVARIRYEAGKSVLVEVLDALAARTRAESNVVQALFQYNAARDQLRRAIGDDPMR